MSGPSKRTLTGMFLQEKPGQKVPVVVYRPLGKVQSGSLGTRLLFQALPWSGYARDDSEIWKTLSSQDQNTLPSSPFSYLLAGMLYDGWSYSSHIGPLHKPEDEKQIRAEVLPPDPHVKEK